MHIIYYISNAGSVQTLDQAIIQLRCHLRINVVIQTQNQAFSINILRLNMLIKPVTFVYQFPIELIGKQSLYTLLPAPFCTSRKLNSVLLTLRQLQQYKYKVSGQANTQAALTHPSLAHTCPDMTR